MSVAPVFSGGGSFLRLSFAPPRPVEIFFSFCWCAVVRLLQPPLPATAALFLLACCRPLFPLSGSGCPPSTDKRLVVSSLAAGLVLCGGNIPWRCQGPCSGTPFIPIH